MTTPPVLWLLLLFLFPPFGFDLISFVSLRNRHLIRIGGKFGGGKKEIEGGKKENVSLFSIKKLETLRMQSTGFQMNSIQIRERERERERERVRKRE